MKTWKTRDACVASGGSELLFFAAGDYQKIQTDKWGYIYGWEGNGMVLALVRGNKTYGYEYLKFEYINRKWMLVGVSGPDDEELAEIDLVDTTQTAESAKSFFTLGNYASLSEDYRMGIVIGYGWGLLLGCTMGRMNTNLKFARIWIRCSANLKGQERQWIFCLK